MSQLIVLAVFFQGQEVEVLERSASEPDLSTVNEDALLLRDRTGQSIFTSHPIMCVFVPGLPEGLVVSYWRTCFYVRMLSCPVKSSLHIRESFRHLIIIC